MVLSFKVGDEAFLPCFVSRLGTCQVGLLISKAAASSSKEFIFSLVASLLLGPDGQMQFSVLCLGLFNNTLKTVLHFGS